MNGLLLRELSSHHTRTSSHHVLTLTTVRRVVLVLQLPSVVVASILV